MRKSLERDFDLCNKDVITLLRFIKLCLFACFVLFCF